MKFKYRINKRSNVYITLFACSVAIWMMVNRFGLAVDDLMRFVWVSIVIIGAIICITVPFGLLLRWLMSRQDRSSDR